MREAHYDAPMREEGKLAETAQYLQEQAQRDGGKLTLGDGIAELGRFTPASQDFV